MNGFCCRIDLGRSVLTNCSNQVVTTDEWQQAVTEPDGDGHSRGHRSRLMFDGYLIDADVEHLARQIERGNLGFLNTSDGHFSGILLRANGDLVGVCDRFGGKTLYWQAVSASQLIVSSRAQLMPVYDYEADALGHFECLRHRCISGSRTLLRTVRQLPAYHTITFARTTSGEASPYWQLPAPSYNTNPLLEKVAATRAALVASLKRGRKHHNNAAIFLSGGVDSSLLAALCKEVFDRCLLVTPDFGDWLNPELDRAKESARILNIDHVVIQVEPSELEQDLRELIALKMEPLRHYSSLAMSAMMRAIPGEYRLVVYGCTADILFGMAGIKRLCAQTFDRNTLRDSILRFVNVLYPYSEAARLLVESITDNELVGHEAWRWAEGIANTNALEVRYLTQQAVIAP